MAKLQQKFSCNLANEILFSGSNGPPNSTASRGSGWNAGGDSQGNNGATPWNVVGRQPGQREPGLDNEGAISGWGSGGGNGGGGGPGGNGAGAGSGNGNGWGAAPGGSSSASSWSR